jgi:hypothetical protein
MKDMTLVHFLILTLAIYRLTRLVIEDTVLEKVRDKIWSRFPESHGIGYLITCYWCTGFWVSSLVVISYIIVPVPALAISSILAFSSAAGLIAAWMNK